MWDGWMGVRPNVRGPKKYWACPSFLGSGVDLKEFATPRLDLLTTHYENCSLYSIYCHAVPSVAWLNICLMVSVGPLLWSVDGWRYWGQSCSITLECSGRIPGHSHGSYHSSYLVMMAGQLWWATESLVLSSRATIGNRRTKPTARLDTTLVTGLWHSRVDLIVIKCLLAWISGS